MLNRRPRLVVSALVAALTLVAFAPIVGNDFVSFDDPLYVTENPVVQRGLTFANMRWALTATDAVYWHPLTWLSHMADWQLFGAAAGGHHLTSLLLHVANTVLLFLVLENATGTLWPSAIVAALFGVHPLHVESVAWVSERKDVLSTLFFLLGLRAYVAYARRGGFALYATVAASLALGLAAKPMLVTFPFVLLLFDYWPLARRDRRPLALVLEKLPLFALVLADTAFSVVAGRKVGAVRSLSFFPFPARLANATLAYIGYLRNTLWPTDLAFFYPYPSAFEPWRVAAAVAALAGISILALALARRAPYIVVGWLWYLGTLLPTIGLIQVGHQSMADRYTYVPLVGIFLAGVFAVRAVAERLRLSPRVLAAAVLLTLGACVLVTRAQAAHWRTSIALFSHALAVTTDNYMAHQGLGQALVREGRRDEGIDHFREALRIAPTLVEAHLALADALLEEDDQATAIAHYTEALRLKPDATAHAKLGNALWHAGKAGDATVHFEEAVRLAPDDAESLSNLGAVLLSLGKRDQALARLEAAVRLDPSNAAARGNLGFALAANGRLDEATRELEEAIRLKPDFANAHFNLGNVLLTNGRAEDAVAQYEQALAANPPYAEAHNNLGVALERLGRPAEARSHYTEALRLRPDYGAAAENLARLDRSG
jgi:protein O-mannosyl-transferase